ncbi:MAG TPA: hypothetical protein VKT25_12315, partial [Ktedonobacteraceae bacterium]|nr:hypothetical protein [Ktedonobacteraceae bacterium]
MPTELDVDPILPDQLSEIQLNGERVLLHLEFQRNHDPDMAERLWDYNVRATRRYKCNVWSCVIYLKKGTTLDQPYMLRALSIGWNIHRFDFSIVRLWEVPTEELWEKGLQGLYPLLVLTREGARREVVEGVISELVPSPAANAADLLALTFGLASLTFEKEDDQHW